jgi:hypothetical protein
MIASAHNGTRTLVDFQDAGLSVLEKIVSPSEANWLGGLFWSILDSPAPPATKLATVGDLRDLMSEVISSRERVTQAELALPLGGRP